MKPPRRAIDPIETINAETPAPRLDLCAADMLIDMDCIVVTADDGKRALELAESEKPTAMLLDFAMPGINGAEVARKCLANRPDTRIVFAAGFAQSDAIDAAVGENAIMLRKPFSPGALADALRRSLVA